MKIEAFVRTFSLTIMLGSLAFLVVALALCGIEMAARFLKGTLNFSDPATIAVIAAFITCFIAFVAGTVAAARTPSK